MSEKVPQVDVGILTLREDELAAVHERFPSEGIVDRGRRYSLSRVPLDGGESYQVAVSRIVQTTSSDGAAEALRHLVEDLAPRLVLLVGVAVAMPSDEITLGDVVVATRVVNGNDLRSDHVPLDEPMHQDVARWASNLSVLAMHGWGDEALTGPEPGLPPQIYAEDRLLYPLIRSLRQHFSGRWQGAVTPHNKLRPPRPAAGTIVAIDRALNGTHIDRIWEALEADTLREDTLAVEVKTWEAYGAARALGIPVMPIRGIGQMFGMNRDPGWIEYACKVAASFAFAFLKTRPIPPYSSTQHDTRTSESPPDRPINLASTFHISHLALSSVRGFRDLDLRLNAPPQPEQGQWTILLGNNGVGKTTILRALALALAPADVAPSILGRTGPVSPTVRAGADLASIRVGTPGEDQVTTLHIEPIKGGEKLGRRVYAQVPMPFLVAYGSRRGSGLTGATRGAEFIPVAAVETLFDEGANLIQPDGWLKDWQLAALQGPGSPDARFFEAILATLGALLPDVKQIHVSREAVEVEGPSIGRVPLGALSDGYRTTMGWVLDMVARWVEEAKRQNLPVDKDFHEKMTGVALIDEIDLHLHPQWQRDEIEMVRRHFPRMSFVVTTHNPLTLLGARPGEIHVLTRTEQGDVRVEQRDLPPGIDAEQVLTGDWFGLTSTLDDATLKLLAEHQQLILEHGLEAPEAVKKEEELRRRLGSYADTSIERLAHEAAARVVGKDVRRLTLEERRDVQEKITELLQQERPAQTKKSKPSPAKRKPPPAKGTTKARRTGRSTG
jgi:nucleoside phosphorylase/energy-coupling factor transporter ATP-binding protein EcfA2